MVTLELCSSAELIQTLGEVGVNGPSVKLGMTSWKEKQALPVHSCVVL